MRIEADLFLIFYESLLSKFIATVYKVDRNDQWVEEEIWNRNYACEEAFEVSTYNHFYRKKVSILKDKPQTIPIAPRTLVKALKYLGFELANEKVALSGLVLKAMDKAHADLLWEQFKEKQHTTKEASSEIEITSHENAVSSPDVSKNLNSSRSLPDTMLEEEFLNAVVTNTEVFNPSKIKELFYSFFEFIQQKKYYDAWILLSPEFQKRSLWAGDLNRFENSFSNVRLLSIDGINDFSFQHKKITFTAKYWEKGDEIDVQQLLEDLKEGKNTSLFKHAFSKFHEILEAFLNNEKITSRCNWIYPMDRYYFNEPIYSSTTSEEFYKVIEKTTGDYNFQKTFLIALKGLHPLFSRYKYKLTEYADDFNAFVTCTHSHERWFIDGLQIYPIQISGMF